MTKKTFINGIKLLILAVFLYLTFEYYLDNIFIVIPHYRETWIDMMNRSIVKLSPQQVEHFYHLLKTAEIVDKIFLFLFCCFVSAIAFYFCRIILFPNDPQKWKLPQFFVSNKKRIHIFIVVMIIFFFVGALIIPSYPAIYTLRIQNFLFVEKLHSLKNDSSTEPQ